MHPSFWKWLFFKLYTCLSISQRIVKKNLLGVDKTLYDGSFVQGENFFQMPCLIIKGLEAASAMVMSGAPSPPLRGGGICPGA